MAFSYNSQKHMFMLLFLEKQHFLDTPGVVFLSLDFFIFIDSY